jgi:anti-repressor protein
MINPAIGHVSHLQSPCGLLRTAHIDGQPMVFLADVARALELRERDILSRLPDNAWAAAVVALPDEGDMLVTLLTEGGLYRALFQSRKPSAVHFTSWVADELLPELRRQSLLGVTRERDRLASLAASVRVRADAWEALASCEGDWSVSDAAKLLRRDGRETGPRTLWRQLTLLGWIFRPLPDERPVPRQPAIEAGWLAYRAVTRTGRDGTRKIGNPQVRITPAGLLVLKRTLD